MTSPDCTNSRSQLELRALLEEFGTANRSEAEAGILRTLNALIVLTATVDIAKGLA